MQLNIYSPANFNGDKAETAQGIVELVNGYIEQTSGVPVVKMRPGLSVKHSLNTGNRVNLFWWEAKQKLIAISGNRMFVKASKTGALVEVTGITLGSGNRVFFSADEHGVTMSAGLQIQWWDGQSSSVVTVSDPAAPSAITSLTYLKGYTIASILNSQQFAFAVYGPLDSRSAPPPWNPLYISAAANPDNTMCLAAGWEELFVLGRESAQSHYASGDATVPFPPLNGSVVEIGTVNSKTLQKLDNGWFFLTPSYQVVKVQGRTPAEISQQIEQDMRNLTYYDKAEAIALFNRFYMLSFPSDHKTFVFDTRYNTWYRWEAWDSTNARYRKFPGISAVYAKPWSQQYVGGFNGEIFEMSHSTTEDNSEIIRLAILTGHLDHGTDKRKFSQSLSLRLRRGEKP